MSSNRIGPNGPFVFNSGISAPFTAQSSAYSTLVTDFIIAVDTTGAAVTITIPTAQATAGRIIILSDGGGNATANNITLATAGAETIDGNATAAIVADDGSLRVVSDGTKWFTW